MKRNKRYITLKILAAVLVTSCLTTTTSFAGQWVQEGSNWKYQNDNGSYATSWQWIDGKSYCFDQNGNMYVSTTTPDGHTVDGSGAWTVNGVVQTQGTTETQSSSNDETYPLSHLKDWFAVGSDGCLYWKWDMDYIWQLNPESDSYAAYNYQFNHTGTKEILMRQAIAARNTLYLITPTTPELLVLAKLAGVSPVGYEEYANSAEIVALEDSTREFLNSFDWRNASDFEKAVKISERINKADYKAEGDATATTYGCLVNGYANCDGYTSAGTFLALCTNTPASLIVIGNHDYPVYYLNGIWVSHEPTQKNSFFTVADYTDAMYGSQKQYYIPFAEYCVRTGYSTPTESQVIQAFGNKVNGFGGNLTIRFH